jgi:hypothetical protein
MKKFMLNSALFLFLAHYAPAAQFNQDSTANDASLWSGGVQITSTDKYVWRGIPCYEGFILQPDAWLTYKNLTLEVWNSTTLIEKNDDVKRHELDAILNYEYTLKNLNIKSFFNYYHYMNQPDVPATGELGCSVGYPLSTVNLVATVAVDVIENSGALYTEGGIELETEVGPGFTFFSAVMLGSGSKKFNEANVGVSKSALNFFSIESRLTYSMSNGLYVQPCVQFCKTVNDDLKEYINKHNTSVGLSIGKEF